MGRSAWLASKACLTSGVKSGQEFFVGRLDGPMGCSGYLTSVRGGLTARRTRRPARFRDAARLLRTLRASADEVTATAVGVGHRFPAECPISVSQGLELAEHYPVVVPTEWRHRRRERGLMYICHCRAVSDRTIRAEIELGAVDEEDIGDRCGAGTRCGSCVDEIRRLCHEVSLEVRRSPVLVAG